MEERRTNRRSQAFAGMVLVALYACLLSCSGVRHAADKIESSATEVVFWHFWGGGDRAVVDDVVQRFNASQSKYRVRAIAMPGNNLDLKFFLSVAGGDSPDLLNQDDPVVADWAHRGVLMPLDEMATQEELKEIEESLYPAARKLGSYRGKLYALANGLDIRCLYVNKTVLDNHGLPLPKTIADLDHLAETIAPPESTRELHEVGFLPDPRRLWAWGAVFGGRFYDSQASTASEAITVDDPAIVEALHWMGSYAEKYGSKQLAEFRTGDQSLPGEVFPLLPHINRGKMVRRYAVIMDGQWRVRDVEAYRRAAQQRGEVPDEIRVLPLPPPAGGKEKAGWVNGNFFVVPRGAKNPAGAWAFMKFWSGIAGNQQQAARTCAAGGWIPVTQEVVDRPEYQKLLDDQPMMRMFIELAAGENQHPTPPLPIAPVYYRAVIRATEEVMYRGADAKGELRKTADEMRERLKKVGD